MSLAVEYHRPALYQKQRDAFYNEARYSWIEGSTKSGKTVSCIAWIVEQAIFKGAPGREFWWVAPVAATAAIAFRRIKRGLSANFIASSVASGGKEHITLLNGSVIRFKSAENPDSLYGEDVHAAVIDEASRMKVEAFYAVRSTLTATNGPVRIIGNVKGRKNWFYQGCRKADGGAAGHQYHKITALDAVAAGIFPMSELDDARAALPDHVFRELYLCEPSDDGGNPFGISAIRACIRDLSNRPAEAFGVDLAKSVDWTVIHGLDDAGVTCHHERFQRPWPLTTAQIMATVGNTEAAVDSTGVGDPIAAELQQGGRDNFEGYHFSQSSKQKLMEGLAVAIQKREVFFPDGVIVDELEAFEYEYTRTGVRYSAPEGMHDDCVMALALAVYKLKNRIPQPQIFII